MFLFIFRGLILNNLIHHIEGLFIRAFWKGCHVWTAGCYILASLGTGSGICRPSRFLIRGAFGCYEGHR
jgi:hypothetical protein